MSELHIGDIINAQWIGLKKGPIIGWVDKKPIRVKKIPVTAENIDALCKELGLVKG